MAISIISDIDLKLLRVFMTVVRSGGFSLAQTELNVSQATISIHIKSLETRLGLVLCQRGRSGFALTEDGQRVYDAAIALFNHLEDFRSLALNHEKLSGELQIAIIDNTINHPTFKLREAFKKFGELSHNVKVTLHVAPPNRLERMVLRGEVHLGIGFFPRRMSQLDYDNAFSSRIELYCGSGHPLFNKSLQKISVEDVENAEHVQRGYVSADQTPMNHRNFNCTVTAHNVEGLAHLILSDHYLAFLPTYYADQWVSKNMMKSILPDKYAYESKYEVIRRSGAARTATEIKFFEIIKKIIME